MATQDNQLETSAASSLLSSISRLLHDTDIADFTLICGEKEWRLHSAILAIRSPFFRAAIATNMAEKSEMKIVVKELDPEGMQQVINFMYGKPIGEAPFNSLLEASERFQMADMKKDVIRIGSKSLTSETALEIGRLAELYNIEQLLQESAELIVKKEIEMNEEDLVPKLTIRVLNIFKETVKDRNQTVKKSIEMAQQLDNVRRQKDLTENELKKTKCDLLTFKASLRLSENELKKTRDELIISKSTQKELKKYYQSKKCNCGLDLDTKCHMCNVYGR